MAADHQLRGERPWLAGDIGYVAHLDPAFLEHLARHAFLDAFARLDETRQRREPSLGPALAAPQHQPAVVFDQHDRDRVGTRKMAGVALVAVSLPAALGNGRGAAALGAEAVPCVPVDDAACAAIDRQIVGGEAGHRLPHRRVRQPRRGIARRRDASEARLAAVEPEKHQLGILGCVGQRAPGERAGLVHSGHQPVEREQARPPVHMRGQPLRVGAVVIGPVEPRPGKCQHQAPCIVARSFATAAGKPAWIG